MADNRAVLKLAISTPRGPIWPTIRRIRARIGHCSNQSKPPMGIESMVDSD
jgi:hypothetical protein